ncbi:hypothetical protein SMAC4_07900 [Sordaria macrospora]|uniref:uncharacterized protein n=1 Tax=Sordaria macrospora TaxID=5147 RepID=UPI002B2F735C|nr:hypothetical protein SMAC4_07900 [Sordaria macrospora]
MVFSSNAVRLTWTSFVASLLFLTTATSTANVTRITHPLLRCPNHNLFQRHVASKHTGSCPVPDLLGISSDLNSDIYHLNLPWSFPPKCMAFSTSLSSSSSSSSSPPSSSPSSTGLDISSNSSFSSASSASTSHPRSSPSSPPLPGPATGEDNIPGSSTPEKVYCLFTSREFRNGQGVSLIVSPITAANLLGMGVFDDAPAPRKWTGAGGRKTMDKPYRITDVKGKGQGVVATKPIKQGDIIMVDVPVLLVSQEFLRKTGKEGKGHLRRRMVKRGLEQLPESMRRKVMGLQKGPGMYEVDALLGINVKGLGGVGSSALGLLEDEEWFKGEERTGLFTEVARINHSCRPNARLCFSEKQLTMEVVSYRPISSGEEILISYTPLTLPPSDRHRHLQQNYHFTCHCPLCTSLSDDPSANTPAAESHSRLQHLAELYNTMLHARSEGFYQDAVNILKDWLDFAELEGLMPLMGEYHGIMADLYLLLAERGSADGRKVDREGALREALKEARMAVDTWVKLGSVNDVKAEGARVMLEKGFKLKERRGK